jgi:hypothetical protein
VGERSSLYARPTLLWAQSSVEDEEEWSSVEEEEEWSSVEEEEEWSRGETMRYLWGRCEVAKRLTRGER